MIAGGDLKYIETFKATGCLTPNITPLTLNWWKKQTDNKVFVDMMIYCERVRDGTAAEKHHLRCCGIKDCTVSRCTQQDSWSNGKYEHQINLTL